MRGGGGDLGTHLNTVLAQLAPEALHPEVIGMLKQMMNNAITISTSMGPDDRRVVENVLSESGISATFRADATSTRGNLGRVTLREIHRHNLGRLVKDIRVKTLSAGSSMYEVKNWGPFGWLRSTSPSATLVTPAGMPWQ